MHGFYMQIATLLTVYIYVNLNSPFESSSSYLLCIICEFDTRKKKQRANNTSQTIQFPLSKQINCLTIDRFGWLLPLTICQPLHTLCYRCINCKRFWMVWWFLRKRLLFLSFFVPFRLLFFFVLKCAQCVINTHYLDFDAHVHCTHAVNMLESR